MQSTRLHHRLSEVRSIADNHYSEPFELNVASIALTLPPKQSQLIVKDNSDLPGAKVGTAYISEDECLVSKYPLQTIYSTKCDLFLLFRGH